MAVAQGLDLLCNKDLFKGAVRATLGCGEIRTLLQKFQRLLLPSSPMPNSEVAIAMLLSWGTKDISVFLPGALNERWVKPLVILNWIRDLWFDVVGFLIVAEEILITRPSSFRAKVP